MKLFFTALFILSLFCGQSTADTPTIEQAEKFIIENTNIVSLNCESARVVHIFDITDSFIQISEFPPKNVGEANFARIIEAFDGGVAADVSCISGTCVNHLTMKCDLDSWEACIEKASTLFKTGSDNESFGSARVRIKSDVGGERVSKAWEFFVSACGGRERTPF